LKRSSIKIGTRGSALALAQTQLVVQKLQQAHPNLKVKVVVIHTSGDRIKTAAELRRAGKGLFVKEIERALLKRKIDCAVHSLKDVPSELPAGLELGAYLERGEAADAFIGRNATPIDKLPPRATIGTASLRRQALLSAAWPHLRFEDLRGNLDTRLEKLRGGRSNLSGIVVAAAGLARLGANAEHQLIDKHVLVPAAGQGTLAIEIRSKDDDLRALLEPVHHPLTAAASTAERAVLRKLEGGCQVPLGVYAEASDDGLVRVIAAMAAPDGSNMIRAEATGTADDPESLAGGIETLLRNRGADAIFETLALSGRRPKARSNGHRNGHGKRKASRVARRAKARRR
jgi:hydroxymethylbilane synthase